MSKIRVGIIGASMRNGWGRDAHIPALVSPIEMPPLRKRKEDIPMLVEYFVKRYAEKAGKHICEIDNNTLELCQSYAWPGNIRELQNIVE